MRTLIIVGLLFFPLTVPAVGVTAQEDTRVPVSVTGRMLNLRLADGERLSGELIEADADRILLWGSSGMRELDYASLTKVEARRHGFGTSKAVTWVGLGALVTAAGMTAACSQVEGTSCGGVFLSVSLSWVIFGGLFAGAIASGQYHDVPAMKAALQPLARFPQGAPATFVETNRSVARPPR